MVLPLQTTEEEKPGLINGQQPGSLEEWRVAKALWKAQWNFDYQVQYFGGRLLAGGQVVDFLVMTRPHPTPTFVDGEYWHGTPLAQEKDALERNSLSAALYGQVAPFVVITGREASSQSVADATILRLFGRAN